MKYRTFDVTYKQLGSEAAVVRSRISGVTRVLHRFEAELLQACDTFETLDEHAARHWLLGRLITDESDDDTNRVEVRDPRRTLRGHLEAFVEDGFLVSASAIRSGIESACKLKEDQPGAPISSIGIPTRDRPICLRRAASGFLEHADRYGRSPELVVADDSRDTATCEHNKQVLQEIKRRHNVEVRYADRSHRAKFADAIASAAGVSPEVARFCLLGDDRMDQTYGAARNSLLLDSTGTVCMQVDDDSVCTVVGLPDRPRCLTLTSEPEANEYWFCETLEDSMQLVRKEQRDLFGLHERYLGAAPRRWMDDVEASDLHFDKMAPSFLRGMRLPRARVAISLAGSIGDLGSRTVRLFAGGPTWERLVRSEKAFRTGVMTHHGLKMPLRPTIGSGRACMAMNMGLDNRVLLPPFQPVLRNEDGLFGSVLSICCPDMFKAYLPYAVLHARPVRRRTAAVAFSGFTTSDLLHQIIFSARIHADHGNTAASYAALGRALKDAGGLPDPAFREYVYEMASGAAAALFIRAERQMAERSGAPSYWGNAVNDYLRTLKDAVPRPDFAAPSDLEGPPEARHSQLRELIRAYGALLLHWPVIVEAARSLRDRGHYLAPAL